MTEDTEQFDVIVVGGGPAGSTVAAFTAMDDHRVLLLESETSPLYKVGESLLPSTVHGICAMLGVQDELKKADFVRKLGGTFLWGKNNEPWTFAFSQSSKFPSPNSFAYQVERMKFDSILLENARRKGVDVREEHSASAPVFDIAGRVVGLEYTNETREKRVAKCRYLVDASGHTSSLGRHVGTRIFSQLFKNVAVFGYYLNGGRLASPNAGNIFCVAFDRGWFWYIPLSSTLTSVGAVIGQEHSSILQRGTEAALAELVASCRPIDGLLSRASRVKGGPYGQVRVRKDYSYCHSRFWRPGLALVGDAACFIDPVFSSGVHLATYSALLAARSINTCLRDGLSEERAFTEFERRYRREYGYFYDFLVAFYDLDQTVDSYYWSARKIVNTTESANEAFIQLVGGIAGSGERLFTTGQEFLKAHVGLGDSLFPSALGSSAESMKSVQSGLERETFLAGLIKEGARIQLAGSSKDDYPRERPLFSDGLVPSANGIRWEEPSTHFSLSPNTRPRIRI